MEYDYNLSQNFVNKKYYTNQEKHIAKETLEQNEPVPNKGKNNSNLQRADRSRAKVKRHKMNEKKNYKQQVKHNDKRSSSRHDETDSEIENSSSSSSSSSTVSVNSFVRRKKSLKKKNKKRTNSDSDNVSDKDSTSELSKSESISTSRASSVSDLLSDSESEKQSTKMQKSSSKEDSSDSDDTYCQRRVNTELSTKAKGKYSIEKSSKKKKLLDNVDNLIRKETDIHGSNENTPGDSRLKKKCKELEREIRKYSKKLKLYKKRKLYSKSTRERERCDVNRKKILAKKNLLESKLDSYENRLESKANKYEGNNLQKSQKSTINVFEVSHHCNINQNSTTENIDLKKFEYKDTTYEAFSGNAGSNLKLPYPVLNDTRDYDTILSVLREKHSSLNTMLYQTLRTLENIQINTKNKQDLNCRKIRLKNLEENIKVQLTRLNRQIDFINFNVEISKLKAIILKYTNLDHQDEVDHEKLKRSKKKLDELTKKMEHLFNFMQDANTRILKQQYELASPNLTSTEDKEIKKNAEFYSNNPSGNKKTLDKPAIAINYYKSVPPPKLNNNFPIIENTNFSKVQDKVQDHEKLSSNSHNNTKKILQPADCKTESHQVKTSSSFNSTNFEKPNYRRYSVSPIQNSSTINPQSQKKLKESGDLTEALTPDSDPKAIAAMLNKKYGYLNRADSSTKFAQVPNKRSNIDAKLNNPCVLGTGFSPAMLNSPAFMSSMTCMLQNMSQQGYNVNAILSHMPKILDGFEMGNNGLDVISKNENINKIQLFNGQQSLGKSSYQSFANQQKDSVSEKTNKTALLPNPVDIQNEDAISIAFHNYLSKFPLDKACGLKADMSLDQINKLLIDSGIIENFSATLAYTNEYNSNNQTGRGNSDSFNNKYQSQWSANVNSNDYQHSKIENEFQQNSANYTNPKTNHNNFYPKNNNFCNDTNFNNPNNNFNRKFSTSYNNYFKSNKKL